MDVERCSGARLGEQFSVFEVEGDFDEAELLHWLELFPPKHPDRERIWTVKCSRRYGSA